ncbi:hypothetical protein BVRB_2g031920 [Beta vulgaris subsp. vulgaris]|uniref:Uncharacterized protein n=1 Tax=Beta vulgaris subsp. vulgaris TaxID=3555 RepID=A0A0J8D1X2_BETVV|nr:hypothetical protein BVRB_2g031920 [Beta vulgaris subsp. vulgaris]
MKNTNNFNAIMVCFLIYGLLMVNGLSFGGLGSGIGKALGSGFGKKLSSAGVRKGFGSRPVENTFTTAPKVPSSTGVLADHAINSADEVIVSMILKELDRKHATAREIYDAYKNGRRLHKLCNFVAYYVKQAYANNDSVPKLQLIQYLCTTEGDHDIIV